MSGMDVPRQWIAERLDSPFIGSGRSQPVVLECSPLAGAGPSDLFVVKPLGFPEVSTMTCIHETLGTMMARALGVRVADPALIQIDKAFVAATKHLNALGTRRMRAGLCFGSRFLGRGHVVPGQDTRFDTEDLIESAVRIYGFDIAFQNCDRLPTNPNCLIKDGNIVAFDFERAFEFTGWRKGGDSVPALQPNMFWGAKKHIFYPVVSRQRGRLNSFIDDLGAFDSKAFDAAVLSLPADWSLQAKRIIAHVREIQNGLTTFRDNLLGVAAAP